MKKGFTLIELLAVIAILAIILMIVMPSITGILNRTQTRLNKEKKNAVVSAARQWGVSNLIEKDGKIYQGNDEKKFVTIGELKDSGFLEDKKVQNMVDRGEFPSDTKICITYEDYQFVYEYEGDC